MLRSRPVGREYRGPAPECVLIRARTPKKCPPDQLILENRKKEDILREMKKKADYNEWCDQQMEVEKRSDRTLLRHCLHREVGSRLTTNEFTVDERRDRLREMLRKEEQEYISDMEEAEETTLQRMVKMRERAKVLRAIKEEERLKFVQDKYDQQFRAQCEELRSTLSKREQDLVCAERLEQVRLKEEEAKQRKAFDELQAQLWEKDRQEKIAREEREAREAIERNRETVGVLLQQMAALETQKEEAKRLKEDEVQLMREQVALRKMEEAAMLEEKRRRQQEARACLGVSLRIKKRKQAREEQEQLAFDLKMLEQLLEETRVAAQQQTQRKTELLEEDARYRKYLGQLLEEEREKERELDVLIQHEVEAVYEKQLNQWRTTRAMRQKLLENVVATRNQQIQDRLAENERQKLKNKREAEALIRSIEENRQFEAKLAAERKARNVQYQNDLQDQIEYNNSLQEEHRRNDEFEQQMCMQTEKEYQEKLKNQLDNPIFERLHPLRRAAAMLNQ